MSAPQAWPRPNWGNRPSPVPPEAAEPDAPAAPVPDEATSETRAARRRRRKADSEDAS